MTLIEAADLLRLASYSCLDDDSKTAALNAIIPAVATVMDAARADAFEEAAKVVEQLPDMVMVFWERPGGPPGNGSRILRQADCAAAIRAQSHRDPKP